jgi:hypothetical protein
MSKAASGQTGYLLTFAAFAMTLGCNGTSSTDSGPGPRDGSVLDASDASSDSGSPDAACSTSTLAFELQAAQGARYCIGAPGTCLSISGVSDWLTIRAVNAGAPLTVAADCSTRCGDCQLVGCPALCEAPRPFGDAGARMNWDGTYFPAGTCGAGMACVGQACATAGDYVATLCGYAELPDAAPVGACGGVATPTCVDLPFVWPPSADAGTIRGTLGAPSNDAGACCPAGWNLYSCTYPDAGAGLQCHNPALGCASSTTCGQGCDAIVTGRCDGG